MSDPTSPAARLEAEAAALASDVMSRAPLAYSPKHLLRLIVEAAERYADAVTAVLRERVAELEARAKASELVVEAALRVRRAKLNAWSLTNPDPETAAEANREGASAALELTEAADAMIAGLRVKEVPGG